jgi:hypothetical protein
VAAIYYRVAGVQQFHPELSRKSLQLKELILGSELR